MKPVGPTPGTCAGYDYEHNVITSIPCAEHVIEIKTRRYHQIEGELGHFKQHCDYIYTLLSSPVQFECNWKVKEVWVDGAKFGVVSKEYEQWPDGVLRESEGK